MDILYSKSGLVIQKIAEELLFYDVDHRIPKIEYLANKFQVGRGTIQSALKWLEDANGIKIESRGHLGTFLRYKDVKKLLRFSGLDNITAVMPLPYSRKYEGLASGLTYEFEQLGLPFNLAFMRGAKPRIDGVLAGRYDFALISKYSAIKEQEHNKDLELGILLGEQTYVSEHHIIFADPSMSKITDGMKIGIDHNSTDQKMLTMAETDGINVDYVELNYMHLLENLKLGIIDATIWNADEINTGSFNLKPLSTPKALQYEQSMNEAVCLMKKGNKRLEFIFRLLSKEKITEIQKLVEQGEYIPRY